MIVDDHRGAGLIIDVLNDPAVAGANKLGVGAISFDDAGSIDIDALNIGLAFDTGVAAGAGPSGTNNNDSGLSGADVMVDARIGSDVNNTGSFVADIGDWCALLWLTPSYLSNDILRWALPLGIPSLLTKGDVALGSG